MIIISILLVCLVIGLAINKYCDYSDFDILGSVLSLISGISLFVALCLIPIIRYDYKVKQAKFSAFKTTIDSARSGQISEIERAAILKDIAEWNQYIASMRYANEGLFDLWIPDDAINMDFIE